MPPKTLAVFYIRHIHIIYVYIFVSIDIDIKIDEIQGRWERERECVVWEWREVGGVNAYLSPSETLWSWYLG